MNDCCTRTHILHFNIYISIWMRFFHPPRPVQEHPSSEIDRFQVNLFFCCHSLIRRRWRTGQSKKKRETPLWKAIFNLLEKLIGSVQVPFDKIKSKIVYHTYCCCPCSVLVDCSLNDRSCNDALQRNPKATNPELSVQPGRVLGTSIQLPLTGHYMRHTEYWELVALTLLAQR